MRPISISELFEMLAPAFQHSVRVSGISDNDLMLIFNMADRRFYSTTPKTLHELIDPIKDLIDNLSSIRTDAALSANQGRILKELIDALTIRVDEVQAKNEEIEIAMQAVTDDVNTKLEQVNTLVADINATLEGFQSDISNALSQVESLGEDVTALTNLVNGFDGRITGAETVAAEAKAAADSVAGIANDAKTAADNAEALAGEAKTLAEGVDAKATEAKNTADAAKLTADGAKVTADGADAKVESLTPRVEGLETSLQELSSRVSTNESDIETVSQSVVSNTTAIEQLDIFKESTTTELERLAGVDTSLSDRITTLENAPAEESKSYSNVNLSKGLVQSNDTLYVYDCADASGVYKENLPYTVVFSIDDISLLQLVRLYSNRNNGSSEFADTSVFEKVGINRYKCHLHKPTEVPTENGLTGTAFVTSAQAMITDVKVVQAQDCDNGFNISLKSIPEVGDISSGLPINVAVTDGSAVYPILDTPLDVLVDDRVLLYKDKWNVSFRADNNSTIVVVKLTDDTNSVEVGIPLFDYTVPSEGYIDVSAEIESLTFVPTKMLISNAGESGVNLTNVKLSPYPVATIFTTEAYDTANTPEPVLEVEGLPVNLIVFDTLADSYPIDMEAGAVDLELDLEAISRLKSYKYSGVCTVEYIIASQYFDGSFITIESSIDETLVNETTITYDDYTAGVNKVLFEVPIDSLGDIAVVFKKGDVALINGMTLINPKVSPCNKPSIFTNDSTETKTLMRTVSDISTLKSDVITLQNGLQTSNTAIEGLESRANTIEPKVTTLESEVSTLKTVIVGDLFGYSGFEPATSQLIGQVTQTSVTLPVFTGDPIKTLFECRATSGVMTGVTNLNITGLPEGSENAITYYIRGNFGASISTGEVFVSLTNCRWFEEPVLKPNHAFEIVIVGNVATIRQSATLFE